VIAIDFSKYSECVLNTFLKIDGIEEVSLVRVINTNRFMESDISREMMSSEEKLKEVAKFFEEKGVKTRYFVPIGNPADEIVRIAESVNASLIAMGSRGRGNSGKAAW
jgi:nucleotide-binding universal stress UspA family protein